MTIIKIITKSVETKTGALASSVKSSAELSNLNKDGVHRYWRRWVSAPEPGTYVWIRYGDSVCYGQLVYCMPELNMYTIRPSEGGSSRLVTRGIEDILPGGTFSQSDLNPPSDDEWDTVDEFPNQIEGETHISTHSLLTDNDRLQYSAEFSKYSTHCDLSMASSYFSSPLFIDLPTTK